jgi:hypothetical protein
MRHTELKLKRLAAFALALGVASGAWGATVPVSESFEGYAHGYDIEAAADWSGNAGAGIVTNASAAIAALTTYTNAGHAFPLPGATHEKVLQISDALTNNVLSAAGGVVISDMLLMPSQRDEAPVGSSNYQFACYVDTNDLLVVWHRGASSNEWITLTGGPALATGVWARITIRKAYATHRYQVMINEAAAIEDAGGWSLPGGGSHPGSWFDMVQTNGYMTRFRTEGDATAYLDDMVFTNRSLSYSGTSFAEAAANDGSIATSRTLTLSGDTFVTAPYSAGTHFSTSGVPAGLSVALAYVSPTAISVSLTGTATAHTAAESTGGIGLTLEDALFTLGNGADVDGYVRSDLSVSFDDPPVLAYAPTTFLEGVANDGSIANVVTINLSGDTFTNISPLVAGTHYTTSAVPVGLAVSVLRNNATNLTVSLTGNAAAHGAAADTSMTITFLDDAFDAVDAINITDSAKALAIDFADSAELIYSTTTYAETAANDGSLGGGTIGVSAESFTGAVGTNYVLGGEVQVSNLPSGLTASIVKTTPNQVAVSFTGTADAHTNANDISNLEFAFQNAAFSGGNAAAVTGSTRSDLVLDFNDPPVVTYSGTTFSEAANNNGAVGNTLTVTLSGDTFNDDGDFGEGDEYSVANEPAGLTLTVTRDGPTQLTLSLSGTASAHTNANDVSDLTISLQNAAFTAVAAADITGASRGDLAVDFNDQPVISYSGTVFSELSGGAIDNTSPIEITITGDAFSGANGSDFVSDAKASSPNVPLGLTLVLTKENASTLLVTLTGSATAHADANDLAGLTITFLDTAFAADADQVTGYTRSDLQVDFNDSTLAINTIPYAESFEGYADGYLMSGADGWDPEDAGVVTSETAIVSALASGSSTYPLTGGHAQVLQVTRELTDEIKSSPGGDLWTECMLYVTARSETLEGSTDYQLACYVNTNQQMVIWHAGPSSNEWHTLAGVTVATGAWHRVTIQQDYSNHRYRLYLDGAKFAVTDAAGYASRTGASQPGDWFKMVNQNGYMSRLRVKGGTTTVPAYLDDVVVTTVVPGHIPSTVFVIR